MQRRPTKEETARQRRERERERNGMLWRIETAREEYFARHHVPNVWHLTGTRAHTRPWRQPVYLGMRRVVSEDTKVSALRPLASARMKLGGIAGRRT